MYHFSLSLALDTPLHETLLKKYAHQNHLEDKPMSKWLDVEIGVLPLSYPKKSDRRNRFEKRKKITKKKNTSMFERRAKQSLVKIQTLLKNLQRLKSS